MIVANGDNISNPAADVARRVFPGLDPDSFGKRRKQVWTYLNSLHETEPKQWSTGSCIFLLIIHT
jgi:hypothetical protein